MFNNKKITKSQNFFIIIFCLIFLVGIPLVVMGMDNPGEGYKARAHEQSSAVFHFNSKGAVSPVGCCVINNNNYDIFIPTKTSMEWSNFYNYVTTNGSTNSGIYLVACYGDGLCSSAIGEDCSNTPIDCGVCGGGSPTPVSGGGLGYIFLTS